jgi:hypothetical protein
MINRIANDHDGTKNENEVNCREAPYPAIQLQIVFDSAESKSLYQ